MDTNQLKALLEAMRSTPQGVDAQIVLIVVTLIVSNLMTLAGMILAYLTNSHAKDTKAEVTKIEHSVNSERTATLDEIRQLRELVLRLSEEKEGLKATARANELRDASAQSPAPPPPSSPEFVTEARMIELLNIRDKNR